MGSELSRLSDFDERLLTPPQGVAYPVAREEVGAARDGALAWAEYLALRAVQGGLRRLPDPIFRPLTGAGGRAARALDRSRTRIARDFVRTALPDLGPREVDRLVLSSWRHLLQVAVGFQELHERVRGHRLGEHYELEACDGFRELVGAGTGAIFITAHVGMWEALGPPLNALGFQPLYAVGKPPRNDPLARYVQRTRELAGGIMLPRRGAMKGVPAVVRSGGAVVMLLDQRARVKPIYASFFGRPAACDRSVGVLLRRVASPLVFVGCYATDRRLRFRVRFTSVVSPSELAGLSPEGVVERVNRQTEELILFAPDQYFWLHDRYKGAPPAQPAGQAAPTSS